MDSNAVKENSVIKCIDLGLLAQKTCIDDEENKEPWQRVGEELSKSFEDIGFTYIKNHGIPKDIINNMFEIGAKFFALPDNIKEKYAQGIGRGYVQKDRERLYKTGEAFEYRESYNVRSLYDVHPTEVGEFREAAEKLIEQSKCLTYKLLRCIEMGLDIPKGTLLTKHMMPMSPMNCTTLRILHYPPIPVDIKEGVMRCGAHSDYGTLTLLFQDNMGGLEVKNRDGLWVKADPIPDTILINVGDLLENWTSGKFIATKHRVVIPEEEVQKRCPRRSMAFFVNAENDLVVKPWDGSSTYSPIGAYQHVLNRLNETYLY